MQGLLCFLCAMFQKNLSQNNFDIRIILWAVYDVLVSLFHFYFSTPEIPERIKLREFREFQRSPVYWFSLWAFLKSYQHSAVLQLAYQIHHGFLTGVILDPLLCRDLEWWVGLPVRIGSFVCGHYSPLSIHECLMNTLFITHGKRKNLLEDL